MYSWNGYSSQLLSYYKNPGKTEKFADALLEDIQKAEKQDKVPPGLYAEYGFAEFELGKVDEAKIYFIKERDKWPESAFLMNNVIRRLEKIPQMESDPKASGSGK